jgi:hypothetical protein
MKNNFGHEDAASASRGDLENTLMHVVTNAAVKEFLDEDAKVFLVGSKGTGKSLLLLKKAIEKKKNNSVLVIPNDKTFPVDRLTCDGNPGLSFDKSQGGLPDSAISWTLVWKHTLLKSILVNLVDHAGNLAPERLENILNDSNYPKGYADEIRVKYASLLRQIVGEPPYLHARGPFYFYQESVNALDDNAQSTLDILRGEIKVLLDAIALVSFSAYVFIDNMDTYYELRPNLWLASTIGLMNAVREIRLTLRHIHVYSSVRSDIFSRYRSEKRLQFNDFICMLEYDKESLLEIFSRPIRRFPETMLARPARILNDPWEAFFGSLTFIQNHRRNGKHENIKDYILRHSLWRPRDLVAIGNHILHEKGDKPLNAESLRRGLETAIHEIRYSYLEEIRAALPSGFDIVDFVEKNITSNIMRAERIRELCESKVDEATKPCCKWYPFCLLYRVGVLGYLKEDAASNRTYFYFAQPGELLIQDETKHLPESAFYALHPIFDDLLPKGSVDLEVTVGHEIDVDLHLCK